MKGAVKEQIGNDDEETFEQVVAINDLLIELEHTGHILVLMATAILNEAEDVSAVKTGAIKSSPNFVAKTSSD